MSVTINNNQVFAQQQQEFRQEEFTDNGGDPDLIDPNLEVETVVEGLELPTSMAFVGPDHILVLEKDKGTVREIINGELIEEPLLDVSVASYVERCMCGIAVSKTGSVTNVFLYYTEMEGSLDGGDRNGGTQEPLGNRLYKYELVNHKLVNPVLLLDLPANPGPRHNGGAITIGPDNNIYVPIGDVDGTYKGDETDTLVQNNEDGGEPDGRGGILRVTQDGETVHKTILGDESPLNLYYAYGIRNSFGIDFDPVTGYLWDTENGAGNSDEINLVLPGFNSGWQPIMGMSQEPDPDDELETFDGKGKYSNPELVWVGTVGPTAVKFLNSDKLGAQYKNDMFVGDVHNGFLYRFDLNSQRTELVLPSAFANKIIPSDDALEDSSIVFGDDFGGITDLEVSPYDGYLYAVSISHGKIFKIVPTQG